MQETGNLYLCATPIGNLEDITLRLVKTLEQVDLIAAEDTSHTKKLLNHLQINKKLFSYHEHNKDRVGPELINLLLQGKNIALVSDAGYPGIADPGEHLVQLAVDKNIKIIPLPGANAALCALIASGICTTPFFFGGFLPKTKKHRQEQLRQWQNLPATIILYEAPHRIVQVLTEMQEIFGDRKIALARELTKLYEEFFRGSIQDSLLWLEGKPPRGEFTIVVQKNELPQEEENVQEIAFLKLQQLIKAGFDKKESMKQIAQEFGVKKNELYRRLLEEEPQ